MFTERKVRKLAKEANRYIAQAKREMAKSPELFPGAEKQAVETALASLQAAIERRVPNDILEALKEAKNRVDRHLPIYRKSLVREYVEVIVVALVLALFIRTFIVQAFKIPSGSMIPTLRVGDHILVNKFIYGIPIPFTDRKIPLSKPERGDIVVFKFPNNPSIDYIKRVVGLPGDTIEVRGDDLYVNGELAAKTRDGTFRFEDPRGYPQTSEMYIENLTGRKHPVLYDKNALRGGDQVQKVPSGHYFCMGDNRDHSNDSRYWGFVPESYLRGEAMVIYFSWPPGQLLRFGKIIR